MTRSSVQWLPILLAACSGIIVVITAAILWVIKKIIGPILEELGKDLYDRFLRDDESETA